MTVPLVLSLGIGIANAAGKGDSSLSGFGVVTMASIPDPRGTDPSDLLLVCDHARRDYRRAQSASTVVATEPSVWDQTPLVEIVLGVRAILPLVIFLMFVLFVVLKSRLPNKMVTTYGLALSIIGMCILMGSNLRLGAIGAQTGKYPTRGLYADRCERISPLYSRCLG